MAASAASRCGCLGSPRPGAMSEVVIDVSAAILPLLLAFREIPIRYDLEGDLAALRK